MNICRNFWCYYSSWTAATIFVHIKHCPVFFEFGYKCADWAFGWWISAVMMLQPMLPYVSDATSLLIKRSDNFHSFLNCISNHFSVNEHTVYSILQICNVQWGSYTEPPLILPSEKSHSGYYPSLKKSQRDWAGLEPDTFSSRVERLIAELPLPALVMIADEELIPWAPYKIYTKLAPNMRW